ncbi:FAD-dependent 5-carboxymethylaminomethyl-2-thiouridine(34) oxidoreductase MnmC [Rhodoferax sediminis]|uniref:FAD-dependent oxidoreductase n=1 Tax=Rhodoferax sediminis TaxID=2509614 RepID=A0A515DAW8_9BURK|nr:FAD-dependent 5-carboxymethylaminomethyl-2-thiouridine(34) oxidoreductase MnmC [Rhodoferax sediminis]QDL37563.1 FAD-dependent oxidoreductase [Rhodoferax sediminis]
MEQDRPPFLQNLGLPGAWAGQSQWRILDTGLGNGERFLAAWHAWKADPQRPRLLHYVALEADALSAAEWQRRAEPESALAPLAQQLRAQCFGLLPGFHRMTFEGGCVLLTVCVGEAKDLLREQQFEADAVHLADIAMPSSEATPRAGAWDLWACKALAHCCRRGTTLAAMHGVPVAVRRALVQVGFVLDADFSQPRAADRPDCSSFRGTFNPAWIPKRRRPAVAPRAPNDLHDPVPRPGRCVVIGAGLSGAAVAASFARRGWQVEVLDAAPAPASGASGLPAGLLAPHISPDDSMLSQLSRCGVRLTLQQARALLREGVDWQPSGLLEHRVDGHAALPVQWPEAGRDWTVAASALQLAQAGLAQATLAYWHAQAAWVKPACLVQALLSQPGIAWHGDAQVAALARADCGWQVLDSAGRVLTRADMVVVAAGFDSRGLLAAATGTTPPLQAIRGQISYGMNTATGCPGPSKLPPFPVNGNGHLTPNVPFGCGSAWFAGASYERDNASASCHAQDHEANLQRLQTLLPNAARQLQTEFSGGQVQAWAGVRCAAPDRLPLLGPTQQPGLWVCTAMGSRGMSLAVLCGELLAALVHGEPLPLEARLARRLAADRFDAAAGARGGNSQ